MRRGYDEEKLLRKRFSASLIGIASTRGSFGGSFGGFNEPSLNNSTRSIRALSDCRGAANWHPSDTTSPFDALWKQNSWVQFSPATVENKHRLGLPPRGSTARSASWCSEQNEFDKQFRIGAIRFPQGGYVCSN